VEPVANRSPHRLAWVEGISVSIILFCLVGIAVLRGWISTEFYSPGYSIAAASLAAAPMSPVAPKAANTPGSEGTDVAMKARCDDCGDRIVPIRVIVRFIARAPDPVGDAVAVNEIEKRVSLSKSYETTVRFDDGSTRVLRVSGETTPPQ
jgi:hypothetical protein